MMAWTSPFCTVRSRPLRICRSSTTTVRFLISSIGTSKSSQTEMQNDLVDQFSLLRRFILWRKPTERLSARVDLALLSHHDHQALRELAFRRPLQHQLSVLERGFNA